jgi:hypothetical protein
VLVVDDETEDVEFVDDKDIELVGCRVELFDGEELRTK